MARTGSQRAFALATVTITVATSSCTHLKAFAPTPEAVAAAPASLQPSVISEEPTRPTPPGGLSGDVRVILRPGADTSLGPVVVTAEPMSAGPADARAPRRVLVGSTTDRFDPEFTVLAEGDSVVFTNGGALSHRLFSADLGERLEVPIGPSDSAAPVAIHHRGEARFFCSLHPEESFDLLVTAAAPSSVTDENGWYDIWPLPDGTYRLSIWTRRVSGPVRIVEVSAGHLSIETIWIDPDLIGK